MNTRFISAIFAAALVTGLPSDVAMPLPTGEGAVVQESRIPVGTASLILETSDEASPTELSETPNSVILLPRRGRPCREYSNGSF
jgi:hypothetical protein